MPHTPEDIWKYVAQFLSYDDLCGMIGVNKALFHLGMDARYRSASFKQFEGKDMQNLCRLRDPLIAPRVRNLYVNAWYHELGDVVGLTRKIEGPSMDVLIQTMIETVSVLSNVTEFHLDWPFGSPTEQELSPFLAAAWKTFGPGLRKLTLRAELRSYAIILSTAGRMPVLQEVDFDLSDMSRCTHPATLKSILAIGVAPFINQAAPTLRSLSISSYSMYQWSDFDFSELFNSVERMPNLEKLEIKMQFDMCGLSDPRGLTRILREHSRSLRQVKWTSDWHDDWKESFTLKEWMEKNESDRAILSNLIKFKITMPAFSTGFAEAVGYIGRSAETLTSLSLGGAFLSYDELNAVLFKFAHHQVGGKLKWLSINIQVLSSEVLLMLARMVPRLHGLKLKISDVDDALHEYVDPDEKTRDARHSIPDEWRNSEIQAWKLHDINVLTFGHIGHEAGQTIMRMLAECVPSLYLKVPSKLRGKDPFTSDY